SHGACAAARPGRPVGRHAREAGAHRRGARVVEPRPGERARRAAFSSRLSEDAGGAAARAAEPREEGGVTGLTQRVRVAVAAFSRTRAFRGVGPTVMPPLERVMTVVTRGRVPLSGLLVPSLVLHTIGAKSGIERDTTLMYCPEPEGRILVTGSNFA